MTASGTGNQHCWQVALTLSDCVFWRAGQTWVVLCSRLVDINPLLCLQKGGKKKKGPAIDTDPNTVFQHTGFMPNDLVLSPFGRADAENMQT